MLLYNQKRYIFKKIVTEINTEIFKMSLVTYLLIYLIDVLTKTSLVYYFNHKILLYITIVSGIISSVIKNEEKINIIKLSLLKMNLLSLSSGLIAGLFIYYRTREIGNFSYLLSISVFLIVVIISYFLLDEDEDKKIIHNK